MERSRYALHSSSQGQPGGPPAHGAAAVSSQDARSNLAVQPVQVAPKLSLKKAAVKIVGHSASAAPSHTRATLAAPPAKPTGSVNVASKNINGTANLEPAVKNESLPTPPIKAESISSPAISDAESSLDDMFARLSLPSSVPFTPPNTSPQTQGLTNPGKSCAANHSSCLTAADVLKSYTETTPARPETKSSFRSPSVQDTTTSTPAFPTSSSDSSARVTRPTPAATVVKSAVGAREADAEVEPDNTRIAQQLEREYLENAILYFQSLPVNETAISVNLVRSVSTKLQNLVGPTSSFEPDAVQDLTSRYLNAVSTYCSTLGLADAPSISPDFVKKLLDRSNGDFLRFCAALGEANLLSLEKLGDLVGLCKVIMSAIAPEQSSSSPNATEALRVEQQSAGFIDSLAEAKVWPSQEKRDNVAECRTCILKGISNITSIHQLQALVWGGRIEAISLPEPGSPYALVKFLTAEACNRYFEATANGIEFPGEDKAIVMVEKQPGPDSTNDVIRNCVNGDASRCVRAMDADQDWSDLVLYKLAAGTGHTKRIIDNIKQGKTERGRFYIDFCFSNIYHSLNFKRELANDEDWEHCTISYAPDPCETANGVHP